MMNSILHFLLAAIPVQLKFQIKMKFFHVFSCVLAVILLLISNQFNIFLYGAPLFPVFSIPLCFLFGVLFGLGYVQCAEYEFRSIEDNKFKNEWLKPALKHLIQMHVLSFLALNVYKIFAICYFYPATFSFDAVASCDGGHRLGHRVTESTDFRSTRADELAVLLRTLHRSLRRHL